MIEIFGAKFSNKGAELMLRSMVAVLRDRKPDIDLAIEPSSDASYQTRASLGLAHIFPSPLLYNPSVCRFLFRSSLARKLVYAPTRLGLNATARSMLGLVERQDADALIDISGYAFGDKFSWVKTANAADRAEIYARRGKPVIYMPQMFGPFKNPKTRHHFKRCLDTATRVYVRDRISMDHVRELCDDQDKVRPAPDLTIFSPLPLPDPDVQLPARYGCIIPNEKMLQQGASDWAESYEPLLCEAAAVMNRNGVQPVVLVHSRDPGDRRLASSLIEQFADRGIASPLVDHPDPLVLKSVIRSSVLVVGSRFHGLVAALSTGVPMVALGWAHKYVALAEDFGVADFVHGPQESPADLAGRIQTLINDQTAEPIRAIIRDRRQDLRAGYDAAISDVFELLGLA